jgi:hypothetical protein
MSEGEAIPPCTARASVPSAKILCCPECRDRLHIFIRTVLLRLIFARERHRHRKVVVDAYFPQQALPSTPLQLDFSPPFHIWACGDFRDNCDYLVEAVERKPLDSHFGPVLRTGTQIGTALPIPPPRRLESLNAISDLLSTFPTASTTATKGLIFLLLSI